MTKVSVCMDTEAEWQSKVRAMAQVFKSVTQLGWAASLLGIQQLQGAFEPLSNTESYGCAHSGLMVDDVCRYLKEHSAPTVTHGFLKTLCTPRGFMKTALEIMHDAANTLKNITPQHGGQVAWSEFQNKLLCFYLFEHVDSLLDLSWEKRPALPLLLERASALGSFLSVWVTEGLGRYYCDWHLAQGQQLTGLLIEAAELPAASLVPLHAGAGLSLAEASLKETDNSDSGVNRLISRFLERCQNNVADGFLGEAFEALGLACRNLYPYLVPAIDHRLVQMDEVLLAYFWHGVGRAMYFAPSNFPPFRNAPWAALSACLQEAPHEIGKRNAVAGFAWALTLVNLRHPEVMALFLKEHKEEVGENDAVINGICSSLIAWHDSAPGDEDLDLFRQHRPADEHAAHLWKTYINIPCLEALDYHRVIARQHALGEIFRCQNLSGLVRKLESANAQRTNRGQDS